MKDSFKLRHNISVFLAIYLIFCIATLSGCENVDKGVGKSEKITRELKQVNSPTTYKLVRYSSNEENINNFKNYINEMEEAYIGKDGSLSVEDADSLVNFFYEQVTVAKEEGVFELAEKGNRSVLVKFKDGPSMAYIPSIEGYQAGGQEAPTIFTYELSKEISKVFNLDSIINTFIKNFKGIADSKIDWYKYSDKQGLKDSIDRLEQYNDKVIVVNGHGGYTPSLGSFLISGAKYDPNIHSWDNLTVDQNDNVLITSDMVKELIKDGSLKNSLVIVNACNSTFDMSQTNSKNKFSQTLLDKGASAVVGFNSLVTTESASRATAYILENISVKGENGYPSLQDIVAAFKGQLEE